MKLSEQEISISIDPRSTDILHNIEKEVSQGFGQDMHPIRFAVSKSEQSTWHCELGVLSDAPMETDFPSIFQFRRRIGEVTDKFNVALVVPTGVGAEYGGHAGDATPIARLLAQACDKLILHPNVVNASDINEMPANSLYVEGSVLARFLMGAVGLQPVHSNRVIVVVDDHPDTHFVDLAINTVSAARATYGLNCAGVVKLKPPIQMWTGYTRSGRAVGIVNGLSHCLDVLEGKKGDFDAIALSSVIRVPQNYHLDYFKSQGGMVNPWGGVEAILTHAITTLLNIPAAHSPMFESREIENLEVGIIEPRMSAEAVSVSFLQCVLKGLHAAPKIIDDPNLFGRNGVLSAEDVSCLVIPDGCIGLPTLAALQQGITVIAVTENRNIMHNDLSQLPWQSDKLIRVGSYLEAAGVLQALKAGIAIESLRRPLSYTRLFQNSTEEKSAETSTQDEDRSVG